MSPDYPAANLSKDTGIGPHSSGLRVSQWDIPRLNDLFALPSADELDSYLHDSQHHMRNLIAEYTSTFTRPVVLLTTHISAGIFALRWRAAGTQRFVSLTDSEIHALLLDEQSRIRRSIRIGQFEQQRLTLNHDYAIGFHLRKRARMLDKALQKNAGSGLL